MNSVTILESPATADVEDIDLGSGQGRLAQEAGEREMYSMESVDHVSRIEKSLNFPEKRVSSMEEKLMVVMNYVTKEEKRRSEKNKNKKKKR